LDKLADHLLQKEFGHLPQAELEQIKAKLVAGETVDVKFERENAEEKPAEGAADADMDWFDDPK